ncbi:hypothetical protein Bca52824_095818, partial [Brassica carinata]
MSREEKKKPKLGNNTKEPSSSSLTLTCSSNSLCFLCHFLISGVGGSTLPPPSFFQPKPLFSSSSLSLFHANCFSTAMSHHLHLILLSAVVLSFISSTLSQPSAILIDCGASASSVINGRRWQSDGDLISAGTSKNVSEQVLDQLLSTVRSFPLNLAAATRKFCYVVPVSRGWKHMIRTTYFYGGVNGEATPPPVFDQIVDGTLWGVVNTTADYADGLASYYEG